MEIIPAILTSDPRELDKYLKILRDGKKYQRVQIDFIDGKFAPNTTIRPSEVDLIPYLPLKYDAHLMVVEDNALTWSKTAKAMGFERVIMQMESIAHPEKYTGLALDVHSPVEAIEKYLKNLDIVIVMSVEPGFGGQEFVEATKKHLSDLSHLRDLSNLNFEICVDGGIEKEHLSELEDLGADSVAVGVPRMLSWE